MAALRQGAGRKSRKRGKYRNPRLVLLEGDEVDQWMWLECLGIWCRNEAQALGVLQLEFHSLAPVPSASPSSWLHQTTSYFALVAGRDQWLVWNFSLEDSSPLKQVAIVRLHL